MLTLRRNIFRMWLCRAGAGDDDSFLKIEFSEKNMNASNHEERGFFKNDSDRRANVIVFDDD